MRSGMSFFLSRSLEIVSRLNPLRSAMLVIVVFVRRTFVLVLLTTSAASVSQSIPF
nr:MAG TPA: hypothetical protein [Caudoviricetes sp.]